MRNKIKMMVSAGSVAMILSGAALAAGPDSLTNWSVSGGTITPGACPSGYNCLTLMSGDGFLQRQITATTTTAVPPGTSYYQTIVTDKGVTGTDPTKLTFFDSNFVKTGAANGISDMQSISAPGASQTPATNIDFVTTSSVNSGWATTSGNSVINLAQSLVDNLTASNFETKFNLVQESGASGTPIISKAMDISQTVGLTVANDNQIFLLKERAGSATGAAGTFGLPPKTGTTTNQTLAFIAGDDVKVTLIGQQVSLTAGGGAAASQQVFGFQAYDKVNPATGDSTANINYFDLVSKPTYDLAANPWNTGLFGTKPTF